MARKRALDGLRQQCERLLIDSLTPEEVARMRAQLDAGQPPRVAVRLIRYQYRLTRELRVLALEAVVAQWCREHGLPDPSPQED